jgi:hypothetical protein
MRKREESRIRDKPSSGFKKSLPVARSMEMLELDCHSLLASL